MAIYHLKVTTGSKLKGASGTIRCDYITRQGAYADREEELVLAESGNLPSWASDDRHFWEAADTYERKNGRVYNEVEVALPRELARGQQVELAREFVSDLMTPSRLPYTMAIHDSDGHNPHMHVIYSERGDDGVAREMEQHFRRANRARPWKGGAPKDTSMRGSEWVKQVRKDWEIAANVALERAGEPGRVDCRSYKERGIARTPQLHLGVAAAAMLRRGVEVDRVVSYVRIEKIRQLEREIELELERSRASGREEVDKAGVDADQGGEASPFCLSSITKTGECEPVSEPEGEARDRSNSPPRLPTECPASQRKGGAERLSSHEVPPEHRRDLTGEPPPILSQGVGGGDAPGSSPGGLAGASDRRELALTVMKAALDRAPKDATWKELADSLKKASVTLVPEGTQGDYGRICGLYLEYEGVRLPASEVDGEASYGQLSSVLGTLERSHLGDVCRVVAIPGLGDVHVLIAKRRAALAPEKTGPELELPGFVDRDYKGAREKFEEKLAASRARSVEERREVKAPEELNRPGFIDRVYRGPKEKFLDELARYEAGERRARRGPDPELEARLPGFVDRVYKGSKEKFQEDLRAAGIAYPGDKSGEGELARGVIEGALAGERERARAGEYGASPGGREARSDEREGGGERERDGSRDDGLRRPGFKDFTPVGASEKLLRELKERLGEDAYQRALDARRALGSSEGGKLEDAIGEVERVVSASKRTADEEFIARLGGKDLLAGRWQTSPGDGGKQDEPIKGADHALARKKLESEPAKLTEEPASMQVKEVFVAREKGEVALVADDKHHAVVPTAGLGTKLSRGEAVEVSASSDGVIKVARAPEKARAETPTRMEERGQDIRAPEPSTRLVRDEEPAPAPGKQEAARVPDAPVATPQGRENQNRTTTHQRGLSRAQVIAKAKATGTVLLHPDKEPMQGKVVEKFVIRDKGEAALVVNDKKHAIIYTEGRGNKLEVGKHVALSPDGKGDVRIEPARAVEKRVAEQNKPTPALSNPSTTSEEREAPGTQTPGTSYHDNDALSRAQVIAKAKATGTEKLRLDKEPMVGRVVEKFVVRDKGEAALVVNDKNHVIIYAKGREDQLEVGKYVALSPDGKGSSNVESVKAVEKGVAEKSKSASTPLSERAQPERGVERKQDCRAVLARVEAGAKQKAPALSAIDRARPGKDGEPPAMEQRPTMKEWLKAQQDSGVDAKAPIKHGVIEGKVDRDPVYLKEGKHYVISQDDGSKKTLESSPKLEELRDKKMRFTRNEIGEIAKNLEVSKGRSR